MARYRKKPVVIEALQYQKNPGGMVSFAPDHVIYVESDDELLVRTPNGLVTVDKGDWIIRGTAPGDYYPCKPDVFEATYEPAD